MIQKVFDKKKIIPVSKPIVTKSDAKKVYNVIKSGWISSAGPDIDLFENNLSKFVNRKYACAVSNGTAALEIAVKSLGLSKNDEVIMPSFTIISNAIAIIKNFAKPVLIDSDLVTWNIDVHKIEKKITKKTKAIMLPHIYGFPCDMDKILKICKKYNLYLIEDAAEMLGQKYKKRQCGSFGDISTFSFYANKHITTGEGGMILTNNKKWSDKCRDLRNLCFGKKNRFNHSDIGWNYRFTNIQAALGLSQLKNINHMIAKKIEIGKLYYEKLSQNKNIFMQKPIYNNSKNIYWVVGILILNKKIPYEKIKNILSQKGIQTRPFFYPMDKQTTLKKYKTKEKYPNSQYISKYGFYLPSYFSLKKKDINYISNVVNHIIK